MRSFMQTSSPDLQPDMIDTAYFSRLSYEAAAKRAERQEGGINTMGEKRLHRVLKCYYEPDETKHEQTVGRHIADILRGDEIVEIQTAGFFPLKQKISSYLSDTDYRITLVHPIIEKKWISWIDPQDGSISKRSRSPKKGSLLAETKELVYLLDYLPNERLRFVFPRIEVEDYRLLNGWSHDRKRGSVRYERMPIALHGEETLTDRSDFAALLPAELPDGFTARDFITVTRLPSRSAYCVLKVLAAVGVIREGEMQGRSRTWQRV